MNIIFSYPTAGEFWLHASSEFLRNYSNYNYGLSNLPTGSYAFKKSAVLTAADKYHLPRPPHIIVPDINLRRKPGECITHLLKSPLPPKSFLKLSGDPEVYLPCPELCFLLAARNLTPCRLALFGSMLCSSYYVDNNGHICQDRRIITSKESISKYMDSVGTAFRGFIKARRVLPFIVENAFSTREVLIAQIMCLPIECGGYGLPVPEMNAPVALNQAGTTIMDIAELKGDMLWRQNRCVAEYDSTKWHSETIRRDCDRRSAFQVSGYKVFSLTNEHLANFSIFDATLSALCSIIVPGKMSLLDDYHGIRSKLFYKMVKGNLNTLPIMPNNRR